MGEPGVDEGGLTREMFEMVARAMADPSRGLFKMLRTEDPVTLAARYELAPDPTALLALPGKKPRAWQDAQAALRQLYLACGRITALALSTGNLVEAYANYFLKAVLREPGGTLDDLMLEDPPLGRTLQTLLQRYAPAGLGLP